MSSPSSSSDRTYQMDYSGPPSSEVDLTHVSEEIQNLPIPEPEPQPEFVIPEAPPPPTLEDPVVAEKVEEAEKKETLPKGRASTVLTRRRGLLNEASTSRRTLLGV